MVGFHRDGVHAERFDFFDDAPASAAEVL